MHIHHENPYMPTTVVPIAAQATQGTLPPDELTALLEALEAGMPWRTALRELGLPTLSYKPDWFTNDAKAAFYLMMSSPRNALAIDFGAGSGVIASTLAQQFGRVIALERDPRWCRFMRYRFAEDRADVDVIEASGLDIPKDVTNADLAVVNGVLEWVASGDDEAMLRRSPAAVQLDFLRGVLGTLRPGGRVGIAIENRFHYENFRGASPHGELPYAAVMPRAIAEWMTQMQRGEPYRTWIYGAAGYRRLLRAAGFVDIEVRAAVPDYHRPALAVQLHDVTEIRAHIGPRVGAKSRALDILTRLGALGQFVHSFYISAERRQ